MKGSMWIDGEYFISPVALQKIERQIAATKVIVEMAEKTAELLKKKVPRFGILAILETYKVRHALIVSQPLFPYPGGLIVTPCKRDAVDKLVIK